VGQPACKLEEPGALCWVEFREAATIRNQPVQHTQHRLDLVGNSVVRFVRHTPRIAGHAHKGTRRTAGARQWIGVRKGAVAGRGGAGETRGPGRGCGLDGRVGCLGTSRRGDGRGRQGLEIEPAAVASAADPGADRLAFRIGVAASVTAAAFLGGVVVSVHGGDVLTAVRRSHALCEAGPHLRHGPITAAGIARGESVGGSIAAVWQCGTDTFR